MSENMCKYLSHYARHLQTFGEDRRVYMVPCEARQYFGLRAFDRDELGEPLGSLLRHALEVEARGKLVPYNSQPSPSPSPSPCPCPCPSPSPSP